MFVWYFKEENTLRFGGSAARLKVSVDSRYADMEPHIGSEQDEKRPVVVLQNNIGNRHSPTLIVATVTTRTEK